MLASLLTTDQHWSGNCVLSADPFEDAAMLRVFVDDAGTSGPNRITHTSTLAARARTRNRARTGMAAGTAFVPGRERATLGNTGRKGVSAPLVAEPVTDGSSGKSIAEVTVEDEVGDRPGAAAGCP